jgi:DNA-directed RNA polymerase specialized sigma24 family protein
MKTVHPVRRRFGMRQPLAHSAIAHDRGPASAMDKPGAFQCTILRAFELPQGYRDVFLLKEIQGYTLAEIAAILGITIDTALARWKAARCEVGHPGDSVAMEPLK